MDCCAKENKWFNRVIWLYLSQFPSIRQMAGSTKWNAMYLNTGSRVMFGSHFMD